MRFLPLFLPLLTACILPLGTEHSLKKEIAGFTYGPDSIIVGAELRCQESLGRSREAEQLKPMPHLAIASSVRMMELIR